MDYFFLVSGFLWLLWHRGCWSVPQTLPGPVPEQGRGRVPQIRPWVAIALVVGLLGGAALAGQATSVQGQLSATEQEADEGYFAIGQDTMLVVKPGSALHDWLKARRGQRVRVTLEAETGSQ
jgi:hypothetical protein